METIPLFGYKVYETYASYDGRLLSFTLEKDGKLLLFHWCNTCNGDDTYMVIPIKEERLQGLKDKKETLAQVFDSPKLFKVMFITTDIGNMFKFEDPDFLDTAKKFYFPDPDVYL